MSQNDSHEPVTVTDKRRIDPETGEIREQPSGPAPSGPVREAAAAGAAQRADASASDEVFELKSTLQRVKAEYDNYRKRSLRDQQLAAERTKAAGVTKVAFDRAGFQFHGRVKALADAAREAGLEF